MFLAQLDEIKAAFKKGYSRSIIWKHLNESGKMPVTYASFATYVYQYITAKEEHALDQPHRELKNSIADRTTLAARAGQEQKNSIPAKSEESNNNASENKEAPKRKFTFDSKAKESIMDSD